MPAVLSASHTVEVNFRDESLVLMQLGPFLGRSYPANQAVCSPSVSLPQSLPSPMRHVDRSM
jgi:hypothetical protein